MQVLRKKGLATYGGGVLGTLTAGYKDSSGRPVVSRDGTIHVRGDASKCQGLSEFVKGKKKIQIAFVSNDSEQIFSQQYVKQSQTKLEFRGDANGLTVFGAKEPRFVAADTPEFESLIMEAGCEYSALFVLIDKNEEGNLYIPLPDGNGLYRWFSTSYASAVNLQSCIDSLRFMHGGQCAGISVDMWLSNEKMTTPDGAKRDVPVWQFRPTDHATALQLPNVSGVDKRLVLPFETPALPYQAQPNLLPESTQLSRKDMITGIVQMKTELGDKEFNRIKIELGLSGKVSVQYTEEEVQAFYDALQKERQNM